MAWLEQRGDSIHVCFRFNDQRFKKSLKTKDKRVAHVELTRIERRLKLISSGDLQVPSDSDFATFVMTDGKLHQPVTVHAATIRDLLRDYEATLSPDKLEPKTIVTITLHVNHVRKNFGRTFRTDVVRPRPN